MSQRVISDHNKLIEGKCFTGSLSAYLPHVDGKPYHTFRTYSLLVDGENLTFRNCVFENTAGPGKNVGQAIALYLDGDQIFLEDCVIRGHQDSLFLAPLPEKEREKDGFLGPKQFEKRTPRKYHFKNCRIEGGVDFIFGGGEAYFENCEFYSVEEGYVFAPSTPKDQKYGFVAKNCRFTCADQVKDASCYIARPWRDYGKVWIEDCELGRHIHPLGFHDWDRPECRETVEFVEMNSRGIGANDDKRASFVKVLNKK